jgi:hypothetical protein
MDQFEDVNENSGSTDFRYFMWYPHNITGEPQLYSTIGLEQGVAYYYFISSSGLNAVGSPNQRAHNGVAAADSLDGSAVNSRTRTATPSDDANETWNRLCAKFCCSICRDVRAAPVVLKCSHSFCFSCVRDLKNQATVEDDTVPPLAHAPTVVHKCPDCRKETEGTDNFSRDYDEVIFTQVEQVPECDMKTAYNERRNAYFTTLQAEQSPDSCRSSHTAERTSPRCAVGPHVPPDAATSAATDSMEPGGVGIVRRVVATGNIDHIYPLSLEDTEASQDTAVSLHATGPPLAGRRDANSGAISPAAQGERPVPSKGEGNIGCIVAAVTAICIAAFVLLHCTGMK